MIAAQYNVFNVDDSASAMARSSCGDGAGNFLDGYGDPVPATKQYNDGYGYGYLDSEVRLGQVGAPSYNDNYYNYNSMMKMSGLSCPDTAVVVTHSSTSDDDVAPLAKLSGPRRTGYTTSSTDVDHQAARLPNWRSSSTSDEEGAPARQPRKPAKSAPGDDADEDTRRRLRRMQSNRESARRSRLRKQQHLDELRSHVAQLRAQNSQMLTQFNVTSKQFAQISQENHALRSEALQLSSHLSALLASTSAEPPPQSR